MIGLATPKVPWPTFRHTLNVRKEYTGNIACTCGFTSVAVPHPIKPGIMHLQTDIGSAYLWDSLRKGGSQHILGGAEEQINSDSVPARTLIDREARQRRPRSEQ